ncbi:MAG: RluA family pseudouridine synthase [Anaerovoracaceae bacterium]|jgi:23S rRNA pseudouridine1911/1915/1917 synthase
MKETISQTIEFNIDEEYQGTRLDLVLSLVLEDLSRSYIQKLIEEKRVMVNGEACTLKKYKVNVGDYIELSIPVPEVLQVEPENIPIDIVYEDEDLLVVNKPKGMVVHPGAGNTTGTLVNAVLHHCDSLSSINGVIRPGIVHRLDKDTTGLLVIAKNNMAHASLAQQLAERKISRVYRAIVYNNIKEEEGTIYAPIGRDPKNRLKMTVTSVNSRPAITHFKTLQRFGNFTYIEARLETGRTHQIRVHMAYMKHPLLGDQVYGPKKKMLGVETQMLHAKTIGFKHPRSQEYMEFTSELPEEFQGILRKLGGNLEE